ncbi:MAG TPA: RICIN domain-containing protein [Lachnospiraceae bacterium]|nr:RICIN domain-containing protein [Lachnospiraceae bacterium]
MAVNDGYYNLAVRLGGKLRVMDVAGGSLADEANIQVYDGNGTDAQKFYLRNTGDNSYVIRNIRSDKVLDITRGVAENGTNIQQYSYEGLSDQRWFLEPSGDGYAIVTRVSMLWGIPEMVLDVAGGSTSNGANVQLYQANGTDRQRWYLLKSFDSFPTEVSLNKKSFLYTGSPVEPDITVRCDGEVLTLGRDYTVSYKNNIETGVASVTVTGTGNYLGTCSVSFGIVQPSSEIVPGRSYFLIPKLDSSLAVDAVSGGIVNGTRIWLYRRNESEAQKFTLTENEDHSWTILNEKCDLSLDVPGNSPENGVRLQLYGSNFSGAQKWSLNFNEDDSTWTILNSQSGKAVDIPAANAFQTAYPQMYSQNGSDAQRFYLQEAEADPHSFNGFYTIHSAADSSFAVDVTAASKNAGANIQLYKSNGTNAQKFHFIYSGNGFYRILNINSGMAAESVRLEPGVPCNVQQNIWNGSDSQLFRIVTNEDNSVTFVSKSGNALDVTGALMQNSTNIQTYPSNGTKAQKWFLQTIT